MASKLFSCGALINQGIRNTCNQQPKRFLTDALKKKYEHFQLDNGVPVYLKGGVGDKVLFLSTVALTIFGWSSSMYMLLSMAFAHKFKK